jgi:microcystin-dependent protein
MAFFALITDVGKNKLALATAGNKLVLSSFGLGDGDGAVYNPTATQTALKKEVYRAPLNALSLDPADNTQIILECLVPENIGGFYVRELGIYDTDNNLIVVAKYPELFKPSPADGVAVKQMTIKITMEVGSADNVTLSIQAGNLATIEYVDNKKASITYPDVQNLTDDVHYLTAKCFSDLKATQTSVGVSRFATDEEVKNLQQSNAAVTPITLNQLIASLEDLQKANKSRFVTADILAQLSSTDKLLGLIKLATSDEVNSGLVTDKAITPKTLTSLIATLQEAVAGTLTNKWITPNVLKNIISSLRLFPVGAILYCPHRGGVAPSGFVVCNGSTLSRTSYPDLWAYAQSTGLVTETEWWNSGWKGAFTGGDGSTNFRIPDLRGVYLRGSNSGASLDTRRGTENWQTGSYKSDSFGSHSHGVSDPGHYHLLAADGTRATLTDRNYLKESAAVGEGGLQNENFEYNLQGTSSYPGKGKTSNMIQPYDSMGLQILASGSSETAVRDIALVPIMKY